MFVRSCTSAACMIQPSADRSHQSSQGRSCPRRSHLSKCSVISPHPDPIACSRRCTRPTLRCPSLCSCTRAPLSFQLRIYMDFTNSRKAARCCWPAGDHAASQNWSYSSSGTAQGDRRIQGQFLSHLSDRLTHSRKTPVESGKFCLGYRDSCPEAPPERRWMDLTSPDSEARYPDSSSAIRSEISPQNPTRTSPNLRTFCWTRPVFPRFQAVAYSLRDLWKVLVVHHLSGRADWK